MPQIVKIPDFKTASQYSQYTEWCITDSSEAYDDNTHDGFSVFYFLLKNGFEGVEKVRGEGCPLDEYGLSMVAVCVGEEGDIEKVTCRWNHANGGNDHIMSPVEVSKLIGYDVYKVLKPYTPDELHAKGRVPFAERLAEAQARLRNGESPKAVFDWVDDFYHGYAKVKLGTKYNFINTESIILSEQWFDWVGHFYGGYARVELGDKFNWINTEGKIISNQWYDEVYSFSDGYGRVELGKKFNFINTEGKILSGQWYDYVRDFKNGYARVQLDTKWNFINTEGKILSDQWFNVVYDFYYGYAEVMLGNKSYLIGTNGRLYDYRTRQPIQLGESKRYITEQFNKFYQRMKKVK